MSIVYDALDKLDVKKDQAEKLSDNEQGANGAFTVDLPEEFLNDFYDLREYIRIANMRGQVRTLSIASSVSGEGSSTIATYLAFLMAGGMANGKEQKVRSASGNENSNGNGNGNKSSEKIFKNEFNTYVRNEKPVPSEKLLSNDTTKQNSVLLVDANLHKPDIHTFFRQNVDDGLAEIIEHGLNWHKVAKKVKNSSLSIITAGITNSTPSDLIGSDEFRNLVKEWRKEFRYIVFDSPPVLNYVDALGLAAVSDGVILVVKAGSTRWDMAKNAKRKLVVAQANLLGVALNRSKISIPEGYYESLV